MTRHVVFWSGGLDSTLIALNLLRAKKDVHLITFVNWTVGGGEQQNQEKIRRKHILTKMRTEFGLISNEEFAWDGSNYCGTLGQASMWLSLYPLVLQDKDKAYFGVIKYSDFWHRKEQFEAAFNAICKFQDKKVELLYPFEWKLKKTIIKELKKYGYLELCYHSEDK